MKKELLIGLIICLLISVLGTYVIYEEKYYQRINPPSNIFLFISFFALLILSYWILYFLTSKFSFNSNETGLFDYLSAGMLPIIFLLIIGFLIFSFNDELNATLWWSIPIFIMSGYFLLSKKLLSYKHTKKFTIFQIIFLIALGLLALNTFLGPFSPLTALIYTTSRPDVNTIELVFKTFLLSSPFIILANIFLLIHAIVMRHSVNVELKKYFTNAIIFLIIDIVPLLAIFWMSIVWGSFGPI